MSIDGAQAHSTPPYEVAESKEAAESSATDEVPSAANTSDDSAPIAVPPLRMRAAPWARLDTIALLVLMMSASLIYFIRLGDPPQYIWDEVYHAYTASELAQGNPDPYNPFAKVPEEDKKSRGAVTYEWTHPAFAKLPMQVGIRLFGDNAFGWRSASALFAVIGIGVMYLFGRTMFDRRIALLATGLLLLDGLWFNEARLAMNDIFLMVFLLLAYLSFYCYLTFPADRRWRYLWLTGLALGFAVASKWSALYSIGALGLVAGMRELVLFGRRFRRERSRAIGGVLAAGIVLIGTLLALPAAIYVGAYVQYFRMGFDLADWRELQWQMWWYHSNLRACHNYASPWWSWPLLLRPVWYHLYIMGNPLSWWLYLPAVLIVGAMWLWNRPRSAALGLILLGYFGQWLPWALSPRVAYMYHMLPTVPFACLALAWVLNRVWEWRGVTGRRVVIGYGVAVALSFAFFYSIWTYQTGVLDIPVLPGAWFAQQQDITYGQLHFWLPTWAAGTEWAYKCPENTLTLLDLLPMLKTK